MPKWTPCVPVGKQGQDKFELQRLIESLALRIGSQAAATRQMDFLGTLAGSCVWLRVRCVRVYLALDVRVGIVVDKGMGCLCLPTAPKPRPVTGCERGGSSSSSSSLSPSSTPNPKPCHPHCIDSRNPPLYYPQGACPACFWVAWSCGSSACVCRRRLPCLPSSSSSSSRLVDRQRTPARLRPLRTQVGTTH